MKIDVSRIKEFRKCPLSYYEKYVAKIEKAYDDGPSALDFGTRWHQLQENQALELMGRARKPYEACGYPELENELNSTWAAYEAHYPGENFEFVEAEREFCVALYPDRADLAKKCDCGVWVSTDGKFVAGYFKEVFDIKCVKCGGGGFQPRHYIIGKIDGIIRYPEGDYGVFETKTEKRGSRDNDPQAWVARLQASVYYWVAKQLWPEYQFRDILLNIVTKASPAGRCGPTFRRDSLGRVGEQIDRALADVAYWADRIEELELQAESWTQWPTNTEKCKDSIFGLCPFYNLHTYGNRDEEILKHEYRPAKEYLSGL